ncbi:MULTISPECIES: DUF5988 family protein [Micromonospora]|uniref:Uncharacterized protein n=1 Tax=Micromonospora solifontis TaxID=2487138 RepID=A0ABX9W9Q2_9ACTN|nr:MULTISPECIES: DUF5988 family protein [Micromonospora]NES17169.1 hypothetical protein [Micromonospora sp. PPF5-17B]NES39253.1 hypothetical protein [Micromonospora solifontis]NES59164.1 hypothetical protein [Micromonospora sp. PPF5-6]RNL89817.1 hypothetical protein EFE23_24440 [Micromonospora solifontis]
MTSSPENVVENTIEAVLVGGPSDLPATARSQRLPSDGQKVKIHHRGGYEHFERESAGAVASRDPVVFRWTTRTRVAE